MFDEVEILAQYGKNLCLAGFHRVVYILCTRVSYGIIVTSKPFDAGVWWSCEYDITGTNRKRSTRYLSTMYQVAMHLKIPAQKIGSKGGTAHAETEHASSVPVDTWQQ